MFDALSQIDTYLFLRINGLIHSDVVDQVMLVLSARITWVVVILAVALMFGLKKNWPMLRSVLVAVALMGCCDALTSYGLKNGIQRSRPCYAVESARLVQEKCGSQYGFPSNHASNGMALAVAMHLLLRRREISLCLFTLTALVSYSRIHLGVHYPLDVLAGALFGAFVSWVGIALLKKLRPGLVTVPQ